MKKNAKTKALEVSKLSNLFKALGDPNRLNIIDYFCGRAQNGPSSANVKEVACCCNVDLSVVSRHLSTLKDTGLLESEKRGKEVFYTLNGKGLAQVLRAVADMIEGKCDPACCLPTKPGDKK